MMPILGCALSTMIDIRLVRAESLLLGLLLNAPKCTFDDMRVALDCRALNLRAHLYRWPGTHTHNGEQKQILLTFARARN